MTALAFSWQRRHTVIAGLAILALSNAVVLGGVAWNRSGEPEVTLRLSERELDAPYVGYLRNEHSGLALRLSWRAQPDLDPKNGRDEWYDFAHLNTVPKWLNAEKLAELGFDVRPSVPNDFSEERDRRALEKVVYLVLEFDGPAYQAALKNAEERMERAKKLQPSSPLQMGANRVEMATKSLDRERRRNSRLFAVDAGLHADALRAKYPDRNRYAVVSGRVRPSYYQAEGSSRKTLNGNISALSVNEINVPLEFRPVFEGRKASNRYDVDDAQSPFEATIVYGRRLEPRMVDAAAKK